MSLRDICIMSENFWIPNIERTKQRKAHPANDKLVMNENYNDNDDADVDDDEDDDGDDDDDDYCF